MAVTLPVVMELDLLATKRVAPMPNETASITAPDCASTVNLCPAFHQTRTFPTRALGLSVGQRPPPEELPETMTQCWPAFAIGVHPPQCSGCMGTRPPTLRR